MKYQLANGGGFFLVALGLLLAGVTGTKGQDFSGVPGVVIDYEESPAFFTLFGNRIFTEPKVYLGTPSITIMPNGDYFVSHDFFGSGTNEDTVKIFRSTDKGQTWTETATINQAFWSTIFEHNGNLYLWGYYEGGDNGDIVIRQSTDNGVTWTTPTNSTNGLLVDANAGGTANTPAIYDGRIWIAEGGTSVHSAPVNSNLLLASSWTLSNSVNSSVGSGEFGSAWQGWGGEGQVVASPTDGVHILSNLIDLPYAGLIEVDTPSNTNFEQFVSFPGGDKKFGAQYDVTSGKYYALSNPVLPAHANDPGLADQPGLIRNTGAILSSKDLVHWDVEKIFLYTPNLDNASYGEAFQYFNFAIDGDDLAVVSRTAFVIPGENPPPRGHDSNLITFHTIEDFRTIAPTYKLVLDTADNRVLRYETTQYEDAPLGDFQLGTSFAGAALSQPNGLAQAVNGDVYVREQGGRILRFDSLGNFISTVTSLPSGLSFTTSPLNVNPPADGERSWVKGGAGDWADPLNWFYWGRADTSSEVANFGSAINADSTITIDSLFTVKGLRFRNANKYTLGGAGHLAIEASAGDGIIDVQQGNHEIDVDVTLNSNVDAKAELGANLRFQDELDLNGHTLNVTGPGQMHIDDAFVMRGGTLTLDGLAMFVFESPADVTLDGDLQFLPDENLALTLGAQFNLISGLDNVQGELFDDVILPELDEGLYWDVDYNASTLTLQVVALLGDMDESGAVNLADVSLFIQALVNRPTYDAAYPLLDADIIGDVNQDGVFDFGDVSAFSALFDGMATSNAVPEPTAYVLALLGAYGLVLPSLRSCRTRQSSP